MDETEIIEKQTILVEKITDADMVLVGIGEEFHEDFKEIHRFPNLQFLPVSIQNNHLKR